MPLSQIKYRSIEVSALSLTASMITGRKE